MPLRMLMLLAVVMATHDDVTALDYDAIPRDVFPGIGEYVHVNVAQNWSQAVLGCMAISHAHLLVIDSDAEAAAIREMMTKYDDTFIHLGFSDHWMEGKYNDVNGNSITSACNAGSQWAPGNPKGGATYNCGGFGSDGFQDTRCEDTSTFICEMDKPSAGGQLPGYTLIPNHGYYKYYQNRTTWVVAGQTCRDEGTRLVILNSQEEIDALRISFNLAHPVRFHVGVHRYYGGNDNIITITGEPLSTTGYTRWWPGHPIESYLVRPICGYATDSDSVSGIFITTLTDPYSFICEHDLY